MNTVRWRIVVALILVHLFVDLVCPVFLFRNSRPNFFEMILLGICAAQVDLIAVWAVLGAGRWIIRLPTAFCLATSMWLGLVWGNRIAVPGSFDAEEALQLGEVLLGSLFAVQVPLWIARIAFHWRLKTPRNQAAAGISDNQFQIFHVMLGTSLIAVALAFGRAALPPGELRLIPLDRQLVVLLPAIIICNFVITMPCIRVAFARWSVVFVSLILGIIYVLVVSALEITTLLAILGPAPNDVWWGITSFNLGQWLTVFGTLLLLRKIGFDLHRRSRHDHSTIPDSASERG